MSRHSGTRRFEVYKRPNCLWRWRLVAANNRVVARSNGTYMTASGCRRALQDILFWIGESDTVPVITLYREQSE